MRPFKKKKRPEKFVWVQPATGQTQQTQTWTTTSGGLLVPTNQYQLSPINPWQPQQSMTAQQQRQTVVQAIQDLPKIPVEPQLAVSKRDHPIVGYKRAKIVAEPYRLFGVGMNMPYKADDRAVCTRRRTFGLAGETDNPPHDAPFVGCSCGFYAMPYEFLGRIGKDYGSAIADVQVELFGKVIVCERGWRAERQRVLGVGIDPVCQNCARSANTMFVSTVRAPDYKYVMPLCKWCAKDHEQFNIRRGIVTVGELANEWKVEVRWGNLD